MRCDRLQILLTLVILSSGPAFSQSLALPEWVSQEAGLPTGWSPDLFSGLELGWYSLGFLRDRPGFPSDVTVTGRGCFYLPQGLSHPPREDLKSLLEYLLKTLDPGVGAFRLEGLTLPPQDRGPRDWSVPGAASRRPVLRGGMTATAGTGSSAVRWRFSLGTWVKAPVLLRSVPSGSLFGPGDVQWTWIKTEDILGSLPGEGGIPSSAVALIPLSQGAVLRTTSYRPAALVTRNQAVRVVFHSGPLRVEMEAQALADGLLGEAVEIQTAGGRRFPGIVTSRGQVEVRLP